MQKISIIVPVYNTKEQLDKCLSSIVSQKDNNIEAIIVNDGSTDSSEDIILQYVNKYPNLFYYYKKENTGVSDARNFGLDKAKGDYILFIDSDDYIDEHLIENLKKHMDSNTEIIKFKASFVEQGKITKIDGPIFNQTTGENAFNLLVGKDIMFDAVWVYLFKKDLFTKNMRFRTGTYHEDFGLIPLMVLNAKSVISTDIQGYYYVQTTNSITRNKDYEKTIKSFEDTLLHYDNMLQFISNLSVSKTTKENVKRYYTNAVLLRLEAIKKEDRKQYIKQIKKRRMIQNIKANNLKQLVKRIILDININWYLKIRK